MTEENTVSNGYEGAGLRGPIWTLAGTAIGGLVTNLLGNGGSGLLGGNSTAQAANTAVAMELTEAKSKIAMLEQNASTRNQLTDVLYAMDKRLSAVETAAPLREEILTGKIDSVATLANNGIATVASSVQNLANTVANITKTVVPNSCVCPGWGAVTITPATTATAVSA